MYLRSIIAIAGLLVTSCLSPHQTVVTDTGGGTGAKVPKSKFRTRIP